MWEKGVPSRKEICWTGRHKMESVHTRKSQEEKQLTNMDVVNSFKYKRTNR